MFSIPKLLVSVRNSVEARLALAGGAEIIDVKEPDNGSLGRADRNDILEILRKIRQFSRQIPVSAACGELPLQPNEFLLPKLPGVSFLKLGLAGHRNNPNWVKDWLRIRNDTLRLADRNSVIPQWVAVAYVDDVSAQSPPVLEVMQAAIEQGCAGVLFDTYRKSGGGLFDFLPVSEFKNMITQLHAANLIGVAAGKVRLCDIGIIVETGADVIAVRSAACVGGNRTGNLDVAAIQQLRAEINACSAGGREERFGIQDSGVWKDSTI